MLGCHEFCGYYDWTFKHIREHFGQQAVKDLWEDAIGTDSQRHYEDAGVKAGLRGLYHVWVQTGEDEKCDWTFTLDESRNVLRVDMRKCPSKGFVLQNDLVNDEDYCDHCTGWITPMLAKLGLEFDHEHNHAGQCWGEIHPIHGPWESLDVDCDIRKTDAWKHGFFDRFKGGKQLPLLERGGPESDSVEVMKKWFERYENILVLGRGPSAKDPAVRPEKFDAVVVVDPTYAWRDVYDGEPIAVMVGDRSEVLGDVARRFHATPAEKRPLLMYSYLPALLREKPLDFGSFELPRPVPILPLLIREKMYRHVPGGAYPTSGVLLALTMAALGKRVTVAGIDLYRHPSGEMYANAAATRAWPAQHSEACDTEYLRRVAERLGDKATFIGVAAEVAKPAGLAAR